MKDGDKRNDDTINTRNTECPAMTEGFIAAIASDQSLESFGDTPILQVVSSDMKFESNSSYQGSVSSKTHFTHLRLADGSNDQIVGRLQMQLAFEGTSLQWGDVIMLTSFTPL